MSDIDKAVFSQSTLRSFASEICSGEEDIFVELLGDCQADLRNQFQSLQEAREARAWRDFNRAAHSIKSAARTFGSPLVKELSQKLEDQSEGGVDGEALVALDAGIRELQQASKRFEEILAEIATRPQPYLS